MARNLFLSIDFGNTPWNDTKGERPYPGPEAIWLNTSIFLAGGISKSETQFGLPTTVKVRVSNRDDGSVEDVRVDAYVMNPHAGLAYPSQAKKRLRSNLVTIGAGSGANVDTDPHVLECFVQGPNGPEPWVPTEEEMKDSDHLCVIANCYADGDGGPQPDGEAFDILKNPHHGQRNIQVHPRAPGFVGMISTFLVMPPPETEKEVVLRVDPVPVEAISAGDRDVLISHPAVTIIDNELFVLDPDGNPYPVRPTDRPLHPGLNVEGVDAGTAIVLGGFAEPLPAALELRTPIDGEPGTLAALDVVQTDTAGTVLGGGIRMFLLVTAG